MLVKNLMMKNVRTCQAGDSLEDAVRIMWESDCGVVPVVDAERHVVGIVTDRDAAIAAYTQGRPLKSISVATAMAPKVHTCNSEDTVARAEEIMRHAQVRRLPVVNNQAELEGILSLNDLAREAVDPKHSGPPHGIDVARTLAAVCQGRDAAASGATKRPGARGQRMHAPQDQKT